MEIVEDVNMVWNEVPILATKWMDLDTIVKLKVANPKLIHEHDFTIMLTGVLWDMR